MPKNRSTLTWDPIAEAHRQWRDHGWEDAADGMAMVTSIMRAQQLMLSRVQEILKPLDLSFARYEMLRLLSFTREGAMPMTSTSVRLQVHPTSVTSTVDRLERDGMVERVANPTDGRGVLVRITDLGRDIVTTATDLLNSQFFARPGMNQSDLDTIVDILARYRQASGDFES